MTSTSTSPGEHRHDPIVRVTAGLLGSSVPFVIAVLVWALAAPRSEFVAVGDGRGIRLADSGAAGTGQLLTFVVLSGFAALCCVLVLWSRLPGLRRPRGVVVLALVPGVVCALSAAVATSVADLLVSPSSDAPYGSVVAQSPAVGALFFDRAFFGTSGPSWDLLPASAGWLVWGAMVALFTVAALAHFSDSPDLDSRAPNSQDPDAPVPDSPVLADAGSRTDR